MTEQQLWEKCVGFHGHECGGLTIGYKAALYAKELLNLIFSEDEDVVCVAENDACGIDSIQVLLGCSVGKGNLLFHMTGKQAFSFYDRINGKSVRLVLKDRPTDIDRSNSLPYYQGLRPQEMFDIKETTIVLPERAMLFNSMKCSKCGETAAERYIRIEDGKPLCLDCHTEYRRFDI